jgi:hypothetical protein
MQIIVTLLNERYLLYGELLCFILIAIPQQ